MDAHDLVARHGEHAEGIMLAQIALGGEGKFRQVGELLQIVGMHARRIEALAVVRAHSHRRASATISAASAAARRSRRARRSRSDRDPPSWASDPSCCPPEGARSAYSSKCLPSIWREAPRNSAIGRPSWSLTARHRCPSARSARSRAPRRQPVAQPARRDEGDGVVLRHHDAVVGIAGEGEGGIGQREDVAAMADVVAVGVVLLDGEGRRRRARPDASRLMPSHLDASSLAHMASALLRAISSADNVMIAPPQIPG
jgi:hypothetical protein